MTTPPTKTTKVADLVALADRAWDETRGPHHELRRDAARRYFGQGLMDGLAQGDKVHSRVIPESPEWRHVYEAGLALGQQIARGD